MSCHNAICQITHILSRYSIIISSTHPFILGAWRATARSSNYKDFELSRYDSNHRLPSFQVNALTAIHSGRCHTPSLSRDNMSWYQFNYPDLSFTIHNYLVLFFMLEPIIISVFTFNQCPCPTNVATALPSFQHYTSWRKHIVNSTERYNKPYILKLTRLRKLECFHRSITEWGNFPSLVASAFPGITRVTWYELHVEWWE